MLPNTTYFVFSTDILKPHLLPQSAFFIYCSLHSLSNILDVPPTFPHCSIICEQRETKFRSNIFKNVIYHDIELYWTSNVPLWCSVFNACATRYSLSHPHLYFPVLNVTTGSQAATKKGRCAHSFKNDIKTNTKSKNVWSAKVSVVSVMCGCVWM